MSAGCCRKRFRRLGLAREEAGYLQARRDVESLRETETRRQIEQPDTHSEIRLTAWIRLGHARLPLERNRHPQLHLSPACWRVPVYHSSGARRTK